MPTQTTTPPPSEGGVQHVEIGQDREGQRLDNCLHALLKGVPRSLVYRLLRSGQVRVNGGRVKPGRRLAVGDVVRIPPVRQSTPGESRPPPADQIRLIEQAIVHEDKHFLVVNKPSGLASHGGSGISHGVIELLRHARPSESLELVHRLDRETSGIMVLTRRRAALTALQALIRERKVTKQYLALLDGRPETARFDVNAPLGKFALAGGERVVRVEQGGKPSLSFFKRIEDYRASSLHEVSLATGRTHQIRVHAAHVGHPVAGDDKYASRESVARFRKAGLKRLFLHAARFEFDWQQQSYSFTAPLPEELKQVLDAL